MNQINLIVPDYISKVDKTNIEEIYGLVEEIDTDISRNEINFFNEYFQKNIKKLNNITFIQYF